MHDIRVKADRRTGAFFYTAVDSIVRQILRTVTLLFCLLANCLIVFLHPRQ